MEILFLRQMLEFTSIYFRLFLPSPVVSLPPSTITLHEVMIPLSSALIVPYKDILKTLVHEIQRPLLDGSCILVQYRLQPTMSTLFLPRLLASLSHTSASLTVLFPLLEISPFCIWLILFTAQISS